MRSTLAGILRDHNLIRNDSNRTVADDDASKIVSGWGLRIRFDNDV